MNSQSPALLASQTCIKTQNKEVSRWMSHSKDDLQPFNVRLRQLWHPCLKNDRKVVVRKFANNNTVSVKKNSLEKE